MIQVLLTRVVRTLLTLLGVLVLAFSLGRLSGDPAALLMPLEATEADIEQARRQLGLDRPLPEQFVLYTADILRGDFGRSIAQGRPALEVVLGRAPASIRLGLYSFIVAVVLGVPAGMLAAYQRNKLADQVLMSLSLAAQSLPSFFMGITLILIFSVQLGWTPAFGDDTWRHYLLPIFTLSVYSLAIIIRLTRSSLLEVLNQDYVRTARAKGLPETRVRNVHTLRNALIPVVTVLGLQLGSIISGSAVIETVFAWPGMGALAVTAVNQRDFPVIQTIVLLSAFAFAFFNFAVDLLYVWLDPRVRL
jgi:peptide/nickel transport system permease protein